MSNLSEKIIPLSVDEAKQRAIEVGIHPDLASLNVFRVLLQHPVLAGAISTQLNMLLFKGQLPARLRELIIMRIGWATAANYEWTQHWPIALASDCTEQDLVGVKDWRQYAGFNLQDRAVLQSVDDVLEAGMILQSTWQMLIEAGFDDVWKLEIIGAINNWRGFSQLLKTLDIQPEDGVASWPPGGTAPE